MKSERLGLTMICAALMVIAVIAAMLGFHTRDERRHHVRAEGASLAKLLSRMPLSTLVPADARHSPLAVLASSQVNSDFAYGVVVGLDNQPLNEVIAPGEITPAAANRDRAGRLERRASGRGRPVSAALSRLLRAGARSR